MSPRGASAVATVSTRHVPARAAPVVLVPTFSLRVSWYGPVGVRTVADPKRFKVSATIQIEGEVTAEELRELFLPAERLGGRVSISAGTTDGAEPLAPPAESEAALKKRLLADRVRNLTQAYTDKLGEPSDQLVPALGVWVAEFEDQLIRQGIAETASEGVDGPQANYELLRVWLRRQRYAQRRSR